MNNSFFKVLYQSKAKKTKARLGKINTAHGTVKTPSFVPVATKGTIKALPPQFIKDIGTQLAFVNTYHLVTHPGPDLIAKAGGIHNFAKLDIPLMSDSGGFQVFSLAQNQKSKIKDQNDKVNIKKRSTLQADIRGSELPLVIKLSDDGVIFRSTFDGSTIEFTPEKSIEYQKKIGADLMMAFDECTYYPSSHDYALKAMNRTHSWLERCITKFKILNFKFKIKPQYLYGIIQGAIFEDLRKKSAKFIASQPVDGVAIGGVSVGETKQEMRDQVRWVAPYLPKDKPVHLLGVGHIDDILDLVSYGIDTFDCVEPTRLARMGRIYNLNLISTYLRRRKFLSQENSSSVKRPRQTSSFEKILSPSDVFDFDIQKNVYKADLSPVDENCDCYVCQNFTKAYLHHLFKQKEILGYTLATYHNLWIMEKLFSQIRKLIEQDKI